MKISRNFLNIEVISSVGLFIAATLAIVLVNSRYHEYYEAFINYPIPLITPFTKFSKSVTFWVNDGLICLFFFLLGLEIKREIVDGELSNTAKLSLPVTAAIFGAIVPAIIYTLFNYNNSVHMRGWAIPTAMDTAFCLGVLALVKNGVPRSIKVFLVSLAIIDDILAVATIALFYADELSHISVLSSTILMGILVLLNQSKVNAKFPYIVLGFLLWLTVLQTGVHTSVVGVLLALVIPHNRTDAKQSMLEKFQKNLHPWVAFLIIPIFAFTNAGVSFSELSWNNVLSPLSLGIILGLFIGKQAGIFGVIFILVKLKKSQLPRGATWLEMYGASVLCGIGFTMSLFIGALAFESGGPAYTNAVKAAVFVASIFSAIMGYIILTIARFKVKQKNLS